MPEDIPAKIAMKYALEEYKRPRGRPNLTWISLIKKDLSELALNWNEAIDLATDKPGWDRLINNFF